MISNADVERFIELVEQARTTLPSQLDDTSIRDAFKVDERAAGGLNQLRSVLWSVIGGAVALPSAQESINLRLLQSALFRRSRFYADETMYDVIAATILFGVNEKSFVSLSDSQTWITAIRAAFALDAILDHRPDRVNQRDTIVTDAALRWLSRGYRIRLDGQQFTFEDGEEARAARDVDEMARQIGGQRLTFSVLTLLRDHGHFVDGLFSTPINAATVRENRVTGSVPYGYVLQVAARHMRSTPAFCPQELLASFIEYATDLVSILDVEAFSAWARIFTDRLHLPRYVQTTTLGDFCFRLRQIRPLDALHMLEHLFKWVPPESMHAHHGWSIFEAILVAKVCLQPGRQFPVNILFKVEDISHGTKLPVQRVQRILESFVHRTDQLNAEFLRPTSAEKSNSHMKPLIWQPGNKVLLTAPSFGSIGFIEAMLGAIREIDKQADNKTGLAMESMLAESFRRQGIEPTATSLKYWVGKKRYDCDLLVETPDTIILFEVKKKSLTGPAMAGNPLDALIDICLAMVKAQTQLLRHEMQLTVEGEITFENGLKMKNGGRRVEKIAVTLLDWGGIQDREVSDTLLKNLNGMSISADSATDWQKEKLLECNEVLQLMTEQANQLSQLKGERHPFFDCIFLGVPQILFMLAGTKTAEDFVARLRTFQHTSVATLDMYRSQRYMDGLKASQLADSEKQIDA